jgi:hypothetical protein
MSESTAGPGSDSTSDAAAAPKPAKVMPKGSSTSLLFTLAVILSSLIVAVPVTVSRTVEGILDSANPAHLTDTSAGLAYLSEILGWSFGALGVVLVAVIVLFVMIYRRERTLDALRLPLMIVALQIVLGVVAIIFSQLAD